MKEEYIHGVVGLSRQVQWIADQMVQCLPMDCASLAR